MPEITHEQYAEFGRRVIEHLRACLDREGRISGEDVIPILIEFGLAQRTSYDPAVHGVIDNFEPGAEIWIWLDFPEVPNG